MPCNVCTEWSVQCDCCCFCWFWILMFRQSIRRVIWSHSYPCYAMAFSSLNLRSHTRLYRPHFTHLHSFLVVHSICIAFSFIHIRLLPAAIDVVMTLILLPVLLNLLPETIRGIRAQLGERLSHTLSIPYFVHDVKHFYFINAIILFMDGC